MDISAIRLNDEDVEYTLNEFEREAGRYVSDSDARDFCVGAKIIHVPKGESSGQLRLPLWHCSYASCWGQDMRHAEVPCWQLLKEHCSICFAAEAGPSTDQSVVDGDGTGECHPHRSHRRSLDPTQSACNFDEIWWGDDDDDFDC